MRFPLLRSALACAVLSTAILPALAQTAPAPAKPRAFGGVYPHLAMFNDEGECGTGAVVPWAGRLWAITYAPHAPKGSSDKLYEISPDLKQTVRPESVGGTPANRMIHAESNQLFLGPYAISKDGKVRVIPPAAMYGRHTGNARHLTDPAGKIYYATMEEGLYEVDVKTLQPTELWRDEQVKGGRKADLPGYHGKGLYSGQGVVVYANNGDHAKAALSNPTVPSGVLAEWDGKADAWTIVRRNQFTEVTGPGGIQGSANPAKDPIWAVGWDYRSLILMVRAEGKWHAYRLPKGSHSYDGAHGWNTEWPRIREIGAADYLMTMHGTFWRFPQRFGPTSSAGLAPRSNYIKVVGDFCSWQGQLVLGCDDTAKSEFLNKRKVKGHLGAPGQSQSNLWFLEEKQLDGFGPLLGQGAVWLRDAVKAGVPSDPFLFSGYGRRGLHVSTGVAEPVTLQLEVESGDGQWKPLRSVEVKGTAWVEFPATEQGAWVRLTSPQDLAKASAVFAYSAPDERAATPTALFAGLATAETKQASTGLLLTRAQNLRTLSYLARLPDGTERAYELSADAQSLRPLSDPATATWVREQAAIPTGVMTEDAASIRIVDDQGRPWRLPKSQGPASATPQRICREVCTERDLLHAGGQFYELPAENAGGFAKLRPVARHPFQIADYCSYRGLLVLSGVDLAAPAPASGRIVRSEDGQAALWLGSVDELWQLGKATGQGGPWKDTAVKAGEVSEPYLLRGFGDKTLHLSHTAVEPVDLTIEVDVTGEGDWLPYQTFTLKPGAKVEHALNPAYQAYWLRAKSSAAGQATVWLEYR